MSVRFHNNHVEIDGKPTFLYSGEIEYFRLPPEAWIDRLEKAKAAGLNCVGAYFAWNFHQPTPQHFDFTSEGRDIAAFLQAAADLGLFVIARPGPYICNEWDLGGYPGWLLAKDSGDWRTGDARHREYWREWYRGVNQILAKHQQGHDGSIVLYQLENEHRWGDREFLDALYAAAREDGIEVPLIGNHDGAAAGCGARVADGLDIYTGIYEILRWRGFAESMRKRTGPDNPFMVLEYRGGDITLWGEPLPTETSCPPDWIVAQDRLFTAVGANVVNKFVVAGGVTPVGFNSDHIITDYIPNAAITPWGELTRTFYEMRLVGELYQCLNDRLAVSTPWDIGWGSDNPQVECLARRAEQATFLFAVNHAATPQEFRPLLPNGDDEAAHKHSLIGPQRTQILLRDVALAPGLTLRSCSWQILRFWQSGHAFHIVAYGSSDTPGSLRIQAGDQRLTFDLSHRDDVRVQTQSVLDTSISVYSIPTEIAERTWFVEGEDGLIPLFGNLDLVRPQRKGDPVIRAEVASGKPLTFVTLPHVTSCSVNGTPLDLRLRPDGLRELDYTFPALDAPSITLGDPEIRAESDWHGSPPSDSNGWRRVSITGPDHAVLERPGAYQWLHEFEYPGGDATTLEFLGIANAEISVFLNGRHLGVYPPRRQAGSNANPSFNAVFDASSSLKTGLNRLTVSMDFPGRHNSGQPIFSGFSQPVVLRREVRDEETVSNWIVSPADPTKWSSEILDGSPPLAQPSADTEGWERIDLSQDNGHRALAGNRTHHEVRWYKTRIAVPERMRGKSVYLECPPVEEAWAYVDGTCIGRTYAASSKTFDLTPFSARSEIDICLAVRHNWYFFVSRWGLPSAPKLVCAEQPLTGPWLLREGTEGTRDGWAESEDGWTPNGALPGRSTVWYRRQVTVEQTGALIAPLFAELHGWKTHCTVYWNGHPIGLYAPVGPQTRFSIPPALVRRENSIVVSVDGYDQPAVFGELTVGPYCLSVSLELTLGGMG